MNLGPDFDEEDIDEARADVEASARSKREAFRTQFSRCGAELRIRHGAKSSAYRVQRRAPNSPKRRPRLTSTEIRLFCCCCCCSVLGQAKTLIPSLAQRFRDEDIEELIREIKKHQ